MSDYGRVIFRKLSYPLVFVVIHGGDEWWWEGPLHLRELFATMEELMVQGTTSYFNYGIHELQQTKSISMI